MKKSAEYKSIGGTVVNACNGPMACSQNSTQNKWEKRVKLDNPEKVLRYLKKNIASVSWSKVEQEDSEHAMECTTNRAVVRISAVPGKITLSLKAKIHKPHNMSAEFSYEKITSGQISNIDSTISSFDYLVRNLATSGDLT